jgi:hypothetical protein
MHKQRRSSSRRWSLRRLQSIGAHPPELIHYFPAKRAVRAPALQREVDDLSLGLGLGSGRYDGRAELS